MSLPVQTLEVLADGLVIGGRVIYYGCNLVETASSTAAVKVFDNTVTGGKLIDRYVFAADAGTHDAPYNRGVLCEQGIFFEVVSGAVGGVVYYLPEWVLDAQALVDFSGSQRYVSRYMTQPDIYRGFEETEP